MSEPISRQALEESAAQGKMSDPSFDDYAVVMNSNDAAALVAAARAILDAPTVEWCETHEAQRGYDYCLRRHERETPCQFATYVRVKVGE